jgi:hypothetical protein
MQWNCSCLILLNAESGSDVQHRLLWHDLRSSAIPPELDQAFLRFALVFVVSSYQLPKLKDNFLF